MNNQQSVGEQMLQLQNIAYVKQFMQKGSVKVLFMVTLLISALNGLFIYSLKGVYNKLLEFFVNYDSSIFSSGFDYSDFMSMTNIIDLTLLVAAVLSTAIGLILPITLLYIIIRSRSDNPSVVPSGAVKFLYVLSFIQTVFVVISAVISFALQILSILSTDEVITAIIYLSIYAVYLFIYCAYYILQTKFLGAIKHSCTGYSIIYGVSKGFGILSVLSAIIMGLISAVYIILAIVCSSLLSSSSLENNQDFDTFIAIGGLDIFASLKPVAILFIVLCILITLYHVSVATIAFSYKDFVTTAVRESLMLHRKPNLNNNSAFRTYGGNNSYSNYNYTSSGTLGQQNHMPEANIQNTNNVNSNNNNQSNNSEAAQYNQPISNASFTPSQQFENSNVNKEPITTSGSFGINQDSNNY